MSIEPDLRRLEELGLNASAPPSQLLYDGWLLRLQPGQAKRARSVNAVYGSARPLDEKLAYCRDIYATHDLPLVFRVTPFSQPSELDAELERRGYERFDTTSVEVAGIESPQRGHSPATPLELTSFADAVGALRGSPPQHRAGHLARLQACPLRLQALAIRAAGRVVATGLTIVEDGWAGLFDIVTDESLRRQGYGRQMVHALMQAAAQLGARQAYLQVTATNTPARALYAQFGFVQRYCYWYRAPCGKAAAAP